MPQNPLANIEIYYDADSYYQLGATARHNIISVDIN